MDKVVLHNSYGGLGDCLQYSTLPEEYFKQKGIPFYLSTRSARCRNQEIFDLVWGSNPYFKGYSNDEPNAGSIKKYLGPNDIVYNWEMSHDLIPTNHYAKIYVDFEPLNESEMLIDLTTFSLPGSYIPHADKVVAKVLELIETYGVKEYCMIQYDGPTLDGKPIQPIADVPGSKKISIRNLTENARSMISTKHYVSLVSGTSNLAATIRDKTTKNIDVIILTEEHKLPHHRGEWGWYFGNQTHHAV